MDPSAQAGLSEQRATTSFEDLIEAAEAEIAAETEAAETGAEADDEPPADDDEGDEFEGGDQPDASGEDAAGDEELPEDDDEPEPGEEDPLQKQLEDVLETVRSQQQEIASLKGLLSGQEQKQPQPQQRVDPAVREGVRLIMFGDTGGEEEARKKFAALPPQAQQVARRFMADANERVLEREINPEYRYLEIAPYVEARIQQAIQPFLAEQHDRKASEIMREHDSVLKTPRAKQEVYEIYADLAKDLGPTTWQGRSRLVKLAVKEYQSRQLEGKLRDKEDKLASRERQHRAGKKDKRARTSGKNRKKRGAPKFKPATTGEIPLEQWSAEIEAHELY